MNRGGFGFIDLPVVKGMSNSRRESRLARRENIRGLGVHDTLTNGNQRERLRAKKLKALEGNRKINVCPGDVTVSLRIQRREKS